MWEWIKSWFKKNESDTVGIFRLRDRKIYTYFDGQKDVQADPMILYKGLMANGPELAAELKLALSAMAGKAATEAHDSAIAQIRQVFNIKPLAESGLTEGETLDLMSSFWEYMETLKKNTSPSATLPTEIPQTFNPYLDASRPTRTSSGCGPAEAELSTEEPMQSPMAQA